ncbi:MAG: TRAP transporter large permease subunit [Deinococcales bacterium]
MSAAKPPIWARIWGGLEPPLTLSIRSICALLLLGIVLVIAWQVAARYIPNMRIPRWTEEVSLIMMVWLSMLGSGLAVRAGEHLAVDIFFKQLPSRLRAWLNRLIWLLVAGFGLYLLNYGWELSQRTMSQTFAATKIPIGYMYLALPFGGLLIAIYALILVFSPFKLSPRLSVDKEADIGQPKLPWLGPSLLIIFTIVALLIFGVDKLLSPTGILISSLVFLLILGVPIAIALAISCLLTVFNLGLPPLIVAQRMANGINSTPLLAIPFFILAGQIMAMGGIAQRLVNFSRVLVGPIRGGLAMVNVVSSMLFGGASGSAVADVSANGSILIPMMKKKGYDSDFSVAITVTSSTQGLIIPPSHNAVIYSLAAGGVSIGALFLAGYLPGIMIGLSLMVACYILALRRGYPTDQRPPLGESLRISLNAIPSLMVGLIIVGGIAFGWFTATEAAAIGTVVAFLIATLVYRELGLKTLWLATLQAVRTIAIVIFLIATASAFAWLMPICAFPPPLPMASWR